MKYVSLDIETTGLDQEHDELLQVAMVLEDTDDATPIEDLQYFVGYVKKARYSGHISALAMHGPLFRRISDLSLGVHREAGARVVAVCERADMVIDAALVWLNTLFPTDRAVNVAGKNVASFDLMWLPEYFTKRFRRRVIDAGAVFIDWRADSIHSLDKLLDITGVGHSVTHDALEDARDVIRVLRCASGYRPAVAGANG